MMPTADSGNAVQPKQLPDGLESKSCDWEIKSLDDTGRFKVYFGAFGNVDRQKEVMDKGLYRNLEEFKSTGWVGVNHKMDELPVAYPISVVQDDYGLLVEGQFHSTPAAQDCRTVVTERMKAGKKVPGSVGHKVIKDSHEYINGESVRRLKSADLYEVSFVNLPANPQAQTLSAKSLSPLEGVNVEENLITPDALLAKVNQLALEVKAGRVLSKTIHAKLRSTHGDISAANSTVSTACNTLKELLDTYDPDKPEEEEEEAEADKTTQPPPPMGTLAATNQRNTAGNAIPTDQNPRGATIAADIPKSAAEVQARTEKALADLRARALRAQMQFALLP